MSLVKIENVTTGYGKKNVVENISFDVNESELVGILGTNGCGKTTIAKAICNLLPHIGSVKINEQTIDKLSAKETAKFMSYIPQHSGIGIDISVLDVVMMGFNPRLKILEYPNSKMKDEAINALDMIGISDIAERNYMQLSEGQKQLVILARAIVSDGNLLVMDEPESALDFSVRYKGMGLVRKWINSGKRAGIVVLHDTMLALNTCDKIVLIKDKNVSGIIDVKRDTIESMETKLADIYGAISLVKVMGKNKKERIVMVCESEEV